jgi:hypothetical protein
VEARGKCWKIEERKYEKRKKENENRRTGNEEEQWQDKGDQGQRLGSRNFLVLVLWTTVCCEY